MFSTLLVSHPLRSMDLSDVQYWNMRYMVVHSLVSISLMSKLSSASHSENVLYKLVAFVPDIFAVVNAPKPWQNWLNERSWSSGSTNSRASSVWFSSVSDPSAGDKSPSNGPLTYMLLRLSVPMGKSIDEQPPCMEALASIVTSLSSMMTVDALSDDVIAYFIGSSVF